MSIDTPPSSPPAAPADDAPAVSPAGAAPATSPAGDASAAIAPVLTFRVGVTGHRAEALAGADAALLRARVREVLRLVRDTVARTVTLDEAPYAHCAPAMRVISSLAEGADRIVAIEGAPLGYRLQVPLPFVRSEYAKDFEPEDSRARFHEMLNDATAVLELDGVRGSEEERRLAYEAAGRTMLRQSDLLIAIWDGKEERGRGGTAQMVREAAGLQMPVAWIGSAPPHAVEYRPRGAGAGTAEEIARRIEEMLVLPIREERAKLKRYLCEQPWWLPLDPAFRAVVWLGTRLGPKPQHPPHEPRPEHSPNYSPDYKRADRLAKRYADHYRSSYTLNFFLAPLAVLAGVLGYYAAVQGYHGLRAVYAELAVILLVLLITGLGSSLHWHDKWLDYRLLAEHFRQHAVLEPLGRVPPSVRVLTHALPGDPRSGWVDWLHRARVREKGIAHGVLEPESLQAQRTQLEALVADQAEYHERNSHRYEVLDERMHHFGIALFILTLAACVGHWILAREHGHSPLHGEPAATLPGTIESVLTLMGIMFPLAGGALAGFRGHGEFHRIAQRSRAMAARLRELQAGLSAAPATLGAVELGRRAEEVGETMIDELLDWRIIFREKPIVLPG
jgi:hypothetical protein